MLEGNTMNWRFRGSTNISLVAIGIIIILTGCSIFGPQFYLDDDVETLISLEKIDDYPLYTMTYIGEYIQNRPSMEGETIPEIILDLKQTPDWGCSLFTTLLENKNLLYGRNFDWEYSPSLLLITDPPDGYASVSMVDIAYLISPGDVGDLLDKPINERQALLQTPYWPFDGMNEHGLVIGMAAVPETHKPNDPNKDTIGSLMIMREILDHAKDVGEALAIMEEYNLSWEGGPPLHYLIADRAGTSVLVEFYKGKVIQIPNDNPWHLATNHLRTTAGKNSGCWRYDMIQGRLSELGGDLTTLQSVDLLSNVSWGDKQTSTQWSIVYDMERREVHIVVGRNYEEIYTFNPFNDH
jgi:hypothetical protein